MRSKSAIAAAAFGIAGMTVGPAQANEADASQNVFNQHCARCHTEKPAAGTTYGPSLVGVVGRKAGSVEGFAYSETLKNSGLVWTAESLKAWMANNDGMLPGTRMRHVGVSDAKEQDQIVSHLKSLSK